MNNCIDKIYRPFIIAQYSLFSKSNKNKKNEFPLKDVYEMLSFLNVTTPVWSELTIILLLSNIIYISYNERILLMGLFVCINYVISKIIISRLKKQDFIKETLIDYDSNNSIDLKYWGYSKSFFVLSSYVIIPYLPIIIYFLLQWSLFIWFKFRKFMPLTFYPLLLSVRERSDGASAALLPY